MQLQTQRPCSAESHALTVSMARDESEVREAQRLRYTVFGEEMGARLRGADRGLDADVYDRWCEHLIVRDQACGMVVGTYRILGAESARRLGTPISIRRIC